VASERVDERMCECECVCEDERERERVSDDGRERERDGVSGCIYIYICIHVCVYVWYVYVYVYVCFVSGNQVVFSSVSQHCVIPSRSLILLSLSLSLSLSLDLSYLPPLSLFPSSHCIYDYVFLGLRISAKTPETLVH
jgi:hypothetical protein